MIIFVGLRILVITIIMIFLLSQFSEISYSQAKDYIFINLSSRTLELYKDGNLFKTYPVGVGRPGFPTPTGTFKIINMISKPGWENPYKPKGKIRAHAGNSNPIGTRWIGFKEYSGGEYGIHGTNMPRSVGKYSSHGCVRMYIKDSEELFKNVSMGIPVIISKNNNISIKTVEK